MAAYKKLYTNCKIDTTLSSRHFLEVQMQMNVLCFKQEQPTVKKMKDGLLHMSGVVCVDCVSGIKTLLATLYLSKYDFLLKLYFLLKWYLRSLSC